MTSGMAALSTISGKAPLSMTWGKAPLSMTSGKAPLPMASGKETGSVMSGRETGSLTGIDALTSGTATGSTGIDVLTSGTATGSTGSDALTSGTETGSTGKDTFTSGTGTGSASAIKSFAMTLSFIAILSMMGASTVFSMIIAEASSILSLGKGATRSPTLPSTDISLSRMTPGFSGTILLLVSILSLPTFSVTLSFVNSKFSCMTICVSTFSFIAASILFSEFSSGLSSSSSERNC